MQQWMARFQSTLPRRERQLWLWHLSIPQQFQSTLPRRERYGTAKQIKRKTKFQSTLPRRERPGVMIESKDDIISIHAPTKGATQTPVTRSCIERISIHAPTKGATNIDAIRDAISAISIHAPTKGATPWVVVRDHPQIFQSTLPRRERQQRWRQRGFRQYFNPRSHEGSDVTGQDDRVISFAISIHAPTKGATRRWKKRTSARIFQSTLPRRERPAPRAIYKWCARISIHAPTKGATIIHLTCVQLDIDFNPRSHEGSDY